MMLFRVTAHVVFGRDTIRVGLGNDTEVGGRLQNIETEVSKRRAFEQYPLDSEHILVPKDEWDRLTDARGADR